MLFFPLAIWTDVCSLQTNYKIWREEFCLVLLPCKKVPAAVFYCVYFYCSGTREKAYSGQLGLVGDNGLFHQHIYFCLPVNLPVSYQHCLPSCCFKYREQGNKMLFFLWVFIFLLPVFTLLGGNSQLTKTLADRVNFMQHLWLMPSLGCP